MSTRSFAIESNVEERIWWWVRVYDDVESMRKAARRRERGPLSRWDGVGGCCQPVGWYETPEGERLLPPNRLGGVIRIVRPVSYNVTVHELTHAALATYRMTLGKSVDLGDECEQPEEHVAYILGHLADDFYRQF